MREVVYLISFVFIVIVIGNTVIVAQNEEQLSDKISPFIKLTMKPPVAKKVPNITKIHGYTITDNYHWMRDRSEKKKRGDIEEYLNAENAYTEAMMKPYKALSEKLYEEMIGRIKQSDLSVPYKDGEYWYSTKTIEGKQYSEFIRSKNFDGDDPETLLDQNEMAEF